MSTIRSYIDGGYRIHAHHDVVGHQACSHSAELDLLDLERRLGPDFDLYEQRDRFLAMLSCAVCAREPRWRNPKRGISLVFSAPTSLQAGAELAAERRRSARQ